MCRRSVLLIASGTTNRPTQSFKRSVCHCCCQCKKCACINMCLLPHTCGKNLASLFFCWGSLARCGPFSTYVSVCSLAIKHRLTCKTGFVLSAPRVTCLSAVVCKYLINQLNRLLERTFNFRLAYPPAGEESYSGRDRRSTRWRNEGELNMPPVHVGKGTFLLEENESPGTVRLRTIFQQCMRLADFARDKCNYSYKLCAWAINGEVNGRLIGRSRMWDRTGSSAFDEPGRMPVQPRQTVTH